MRSEEFLTEDLQEAPQPRVTHGMEAQAAVIKMLEAEYGNAFELISVAPPSSNAPDIVANLHGKRTQFEVKGRLEPGSTVKLYETRIRRGEKDATLDSFVRAYTNGKASTFEQYIDGMRKLDSTIGWPSDEDVTAKAGKFYIGTDDPAVRTTLRRRLMTQLHESHDDYFVIYTRGNGQVDIYDTGSSNNELPAPKVPNIRRVQAGTYGSAGTEGTMRVAIKVNFSK